MRTNSKSWGLEASDKVKAAAESGDADAQTELGVRLLSGSPGECADATRWFLKAAEQGHAGAQGCLGGIYRDGRGVRQDHAEAARWLMRAAEQGCVHSQLLLADCFLEGKGVAKDLNEANKWYRKVVEWTQAEAEKGELGAQAQLAGFYLRGQGVAQDVSTAIKWYRKSAESGRLQWAYDELENIYMDGKWPSAEIPECVAWFQKAANEGFPRSQYILGLIYQRGDGLPQSNVEALKWFQKAADHKHPTQWFEQPAKGEPLVPQAQKAVEELRKLLADSNSQTKQVMFGGLDDLCAAVRRQDVRKIKGLIGGGTPVSAPKEHSYRLERCPFLIAAAADFSPREIGGILDGYKSERHDYWKQDSFQSRSKLNKQILDLLVINGAATFPLLNVRGETSIHVAAKADNTNAISIILDLHPDAGDYNQVDNGPTPLEVAAEHGCFQVVKTLLAASVTTWQIASPFQLALKAGHSRTAKELMEYIPERFPLLEQHSKMLFEMIRWSAVDDHTKSFQELVKHLEPIKRRPSVSDRLRWDLWCEKERLLKQCFGDACRVASLEMVRLASSAGETLDINRDGSEFGIGVAPLILAANEGKFELAEFCLRVGADPFVCEGGRTALDISKQNGFTKIEVLLKQAMKGNFTGQAKSWFRKFTG